MMKRDSKGESKVFEIIITALIVALILILINITNRNLTSIRQSYSQDFINILELTVIHSGDIECDHKLGPAIIEYMNKIDGKIVEVYNENYEVEARFGSHSDTLDIYAFPDLLKTTQQEEQGIVTIERETSEVVYFKWIDVETENRKLLLLYGVSSSYFNFSYISIILYIVLILVFILIVKISFIDKSNMYIKILKDAENQRVFKFADNRYEFLDGKEEN